MKWQEIFFAASQSGKEGLWWHEGSVQVENNYVFETLSPFLRVFETFVSCRDQWGQLL